MISDQKASMFDHENSGVPAVMRWRICQIGILFFGAMASVGTLHGQAVSASSKSVIGCKQASTSRPGDGRAFSGKIVNDDYAFAARVPGGFTGWDGVAPNAPFHGFVIFLDAQMESCIVFDVHVRVDDAEAPKSSSNATALRLGNARASQSTWTGKLGDKGFTDISTLFTSRHQGETDDGEVLLVAPTTDLSKAKPVYDAFVASLKFRP